MRVLCVGNMYPPHHLGGYELVWQGAVRHLRGAGHEARVLTSDHRQVGVKAPDEPDVHRELHWYWRDHVFPRLRPAQRLRLERDNGAVFDRHVVEWRPHVVAWWAMGGMSLSLLARARRHGLPSVAFVHDDWLLYGPEVDQWLRMFARRRPLGTAIEHVTGIPARLDVEAVTRWAFVSAFTRDRALRAGHPLTAADVLHSGIDASFIGPAPERSWSWRLLYLGRIDERKGADTAVDALAHLPDEATLTVVGDGDERHREDLEAQAAELRGRVRIRPGVARSDVSAVIDKHDAVVFPARWEEPWGLVPLEAMARGRPVVTTARGGSREYLRSEENCLAFDAGDAGGLAAAVRRLAGDEKLRGRLRVDGLATAREHTDAGFNSAVAGLLVDAAAGASHA